MIPDIMKEVEEREETKAIKSEVDNVFAYQNFVAEVLFKLGTGE